MRPTSTVALMCRVIASSTLHNVLHTQLSPLCTLCAYFLPSNIMDAALLDSAHVGDAQGQSRILDHQCLTGMCSENITRYGRRHLINLDARAFFKSIDSSGFYSFTQSINCIIS